jgi:GT2 family glycosyltransferase
MIEEIGLFRDDFFLYYDETEYCLRARSLGWKVLISLMSHVYTRPISEERNDRQFYMVRNTILLARLQKRYLLRTLLRHIVAASLVTIPGRRFPGDLGWSALWRATVSGLKLPLANAPNQRPG